MLNWTILRKTFERQTRTLDEQFYSNSRYVHTPCPLGRHGLPNQFYLYHKEEGNFKVDWSSCGSSGLKGEREKERVRNKEKIFFPILFFKEGGIFFSFLLLLKIVLVFLAFRNASWHSWYWLWWRRREWWGRSSPPSRKCWTWRSR